MNYFLSQPMKGLSDEEIIDNTNRFVKLIKNLNPKLNYINTLYFPTKSDISHIKQENNSIFCLGKSIMRLAECDCVVFVDNCIETNRGCSIEYLVAKKYGLTCYRLSTDMNLLDII